jgi:hypothetical protein
MGGRILEKKRFSIENKIHRPGDRTGFKIESKKGIIDGTGKNGILIIMDATKKKKKRKRKF